MNKRIKLIALLVIGFLGVFAFNKTDVYASDPATIIKKWVFTQYSICMKNEWNNNTINVKDDKSLVADDIFNSNSGELQGLPSYGLGGWNWNGYDFGNKEVNCEEIFKGENELSGKAVLDYYNNGEFKDTRWNPATPEKYQRFLTGIGYYFVSTMEDNQRQFKITGNKHDKINNTDNEVVMATITAIRRNDGSIDYDVVTHENGLDISISGAGSDTALKIEPDSSILMGSCGYLQGFSEISIGFNGSSLDGFSDIYPNLANRDLGIFCYVYTARSEMVYNFSSEEIISEDGQYEYAKKPGTDRYRVTSDAIHGMSGMFTRDLNLTNSEFYTLYYHYLTSTLPDGIQNRMTCDSSVITDGLTPIILKDSDGEFKQCYVNYSSSDPSTIMVFTQTSTQNGTYPSITLINMAAVIEWFNNVDPSTLDDTIPLVGDTINTDVDNEEVYNFCQENADGMGWALCNMISSIGNGANSLYGQIVEPFLIVDPELVKTEGLVWQAWNIMMGIANSLMVIYLLVVIFSQLTGVGINNYGIKKTLPKLIVAALLINLSFLICQLAVDISNILGSSLNQMLTNIASDLNVSLQNVTDMTNDQAGWFNGLLVGVTGGLAAIGVASVVSSVLSFGSLLPGLIIPILMLLVTVLVSILFFFILLGIRKAAVVIFIIISPLAFVCYMLPNTKVYFDKWYKIFKALLLVYPICGLFIGGGYLVSKILLTISDDYLMYFTGCIILVVPFFFIPKVLKSSFSMLDGLGARISSMGKSLGGWGGKTLRSSIEQNPAYQNRMEYNKNRAERFRAGVERGWLERKNSGKNLADWSKRDRDRYAKAGDAISKERARTSRAKFGVFVPDEATSDKRAESAKKAQETNVLIDQYKEYSNDDLKGLANSVDTWINNENAEQILVALSTALSSRKMEGDIFKMLKTMSASGKKASDYTGFRNYLASSNSGILQAYGRDGNGKTYNEFVGNAGEGTLANYAKENGAAFADDLNSRDMKQIEEIQEKANFEVLTQEQLKIKAQSSNAKAATAAARMLTYRNEVSVSGNELANMNLDAASILTEQGVSNQIKEAMARAIKEVGNDPQLASKINSDVVEKVLKNAGKSILDDIIKSEKMATNIKEAAEAARKSRS